MQKEFPSIVLTLIIPYINMKFNENLYNSSVYPPLENVPKRVAIVKRNMWMVDESEVVVGFITDITGGSFKTFDYAIKKKKKVINLFEFDINMLTEEILKEKLLWS